MTTLLYQRDSYLREFEAKVLQHDERGLVLDRTAFYPAGGGQPADTGTLETSGGPRRVVGLQRAGDSVIHALDVGPFLPEGSMVRGCLDWDRRYALMRTHTAMHVLCGVVWVDHRVLVTGGNMEPGRGRLDFDFPGLDWATARVLEGRINAEIQCARPIRVAFHTREESERIPNLVRTKTNLVPTELVSVRTIEIVGLDLQADGGTHVGCTDEIGPVQIVALKNKGRANKRLELALTDLISTTA